MFTVIGLLALAYFGAAHLLREDSDGMFNFDWPLDLYSGFNK